MGHKVTLAEVPETGISSGRWQPLNERLGITHFGISAVVMDPGDDFDIEHDEVDAGHQEAYVVVAVPDPGETRDYWAVEPGTRIVCLGAGAGAEEPYGRWIAEAAG